MTNIGISNSKQSVLLNKYLEASRQDGTLSSSYNLKPQTPTVQNNNATNTVLKNNVDKYTPTVQKEEEPGKQEWHQKSKKGKIAAVALGSVVALTGFVMLLKTKGAKDLFTKFSKFLKNTVGDSVQNKIGKIKNSDTKESVEKFQKQVKNLTEKGLNIPLNINNGKDVLLRRVIYSEKAGHGILKYLTAPLRGLDKLTTTWYKNSALKGMEKSYGKSTMFLDSLGDDIEKLFSKAAKTDGFVVDEKRSKAMESIRKLLKSINGVQEEHFKSGAIGKRFHAIDDSMLGAAGKGEKVNFHEMELTKQTFDGFMEKFKKYKGINKLKAFTESHIADDMISNVRAKNNKNVASYVSKITNGKDGDIEKLIALMDDFVGNDASLREEFEKYIQSQARIYTKTLTKAAKTEGVELIEKLRETNCGGAPTDIMTLILSTAALGVYTAQAGSKDEKVSVVLNTGIPLLTAITTCLVATSKMISGVKSMGVSLVTGGIAKFIGSIVDKNYKKAHGIEEKPSTIVTLDDYVDKVKDTTTEIIT